MAGLAPSHGELFAEASDQFPAGPQLVIVTVWGAGFSCPCVAEKLSAPASTLIHADGGGGGGGGGGPPGCVHFQGTATVLPPCTAKLNVPRVQLLTGIVIPTWVVPPGVSVPPVGLKFTPARSVLTVQFRPPDELASSVTVMLFVQPLPSLFSEHVLASELFTSDGLTISVGGTSTAVIVKMTFTLTVADPS